MRASVTAATSTSDAMRLNVLVRSLTLIFSFSSLNLSASSSSSSFFFLATSVSSSNASGEEAVVEEPSGVLFPLLLLSDGRGCCCCRVLGPDAKDDLAELVGSEPE